MEYRLTAPMTREQARQLRCGDTVLFTGTIYTARDAAHKRLVELLDKGEPLPFDVNGAVIYYAGPTPAQKGHAVGSCGPTTSYRMDAYAPKVIAAGSTGMYIVSSAVSLIIFCSDTVNALANDTDLLFSAAQAAVL